MNYLMSDMLAIAGEKYLQMLELLRLTQEQTILLADDDVEEFGRCTACKESIIARVNALDARYKELNAQFLLENNVNSLDAFAGDASVQEVMDFSLKTRNIVKEMIGIDRTNAEKGKQLLEKLRGTLEQVNRAPRVSRAYQIDLSGAIFINRQG